VRRLLPLTTALLAWGAALGACSKQNAVIDRGGECFFAHECAPGLVCVEQKNKTRICTDDLSGVAGDPPDPGTGEDGGDEAGEGGTTDGPAPQDTGIDRPTPIDTGIDVGIDTGIGDSGGAG